MLGMTFFGAYDSLARRGVLHLEDMQHAYLKLSETAGLHDPNLKPEYLTEIEGRLCAWEQQA